MAKMAKSELSYYGFYNDEFMCRKLTTDCSLVFLLQIIYMHGFRKFKGTPKSILLEVVSKLELMDPSRSTIQDDGVTSDAVLSIEEVIKDLNALKWQECCITSLQTVNAVSHHHTEDGSLGSSGGCSAGTVVSPSSEKQPRKPRRKLKKISGIVPSPIKRNIGSSDTPPRSPVLENWSPRKKRTPNRGGGAASSVSAGEVQESSSRALALFFGSK
ncbi:OLC1v1023761C3 [Oldenlandia corymbosa var. corymbosa]|uniref:OLC1v1023761C3 n=1 Tax=Oldenlandia corymbosa var. corymbosa TaxID=529605 RepID=A0AAV1C1M0_OLDCO|nr:OLC1v1023761C3 [Oldenlandia corymbosa var. corymbosa]